MKKYISPIAKSIELYGESSLLSGSNDPENNKFDKVSNNAALSNGRQSIWED